MNDPKSPTKMLEQQYKQLLENLMGIFSAKVSLDDDGDIVEVHVLASANRNVKQIVRDVRSALNAHFGTDVDHKLISVAQLKENPQDDAQTQDSAPPPLAPTPSRLRLGRLTQTVEDDRYEVSLTLKYNGQLFEGSAHSRNSGPQRNMCVANATLAAVHSYVGEDGLFTLSGVQRITSAPMPMCMVMVEWTQPPAAMLVGTAELNWDEASCVERATLSAVNRKLSALMEQSLHTEEP